MKLLHPFTVSTFVGLASISSLLAAPKWQEMDYGRFLSHTINNAQGKTALDQKGSAVNKGIAIKLGQGEDATMVFDTDLLRMAGGWTGGFLKLKGVAFEGGHGPNPQPADKVNMVFQTNVGPGWSKGDDFKDPRKVPTGPGAAKVPLGPLPKEWAKYKGLYLNGDNVVLAYTVNTAPVLELPGDGKGSRADAPHPDIQRPRQRRGFQAARRGSNGRRDCRRAGQQDRPQRRSEEPRVARGDRRSGRTGRCEVAGRRFPRPAQSPGFRGQEQFKVVYWKGTRPISPSLTTPSRRWPTGRSEPLTKGGEPHWTQVVETEGVLGKEERAIRRR